MPDTRSEVGRELPQFQQREGVERKALWDPSEGSALPSRALLNDRISGIFGQMQIAGVRGPSRLCEVPRGGEDSLLRSAAGAGGDANMEDFCGLRGGQGDGE